jgi:hypothetical protein
MKGIFFISIIIALAIEGFADITMLQTLTVPSGEKQSIKNIKISIKNDKARIDIEQDGLSAIINLHSQSIFILTHNTKTVMKVPSEFFNAIVPNTSKSGKISFQKTGEKKSINGYNCEAYKTINVATSTPQVEWWLTQEIDASEAEAFRKYFSAIFGLSEEESKELKGLLLKSTSIFNIDEKPFTTVMEVKSISREKIEASLFEVPSDYKAIDITSSIPIQQSHQSSLTSSVSTNKAGGTTR